MKVLVASRNKKKLEELQRVLETANVKGIELVSLRDVEPYPETPETGATFAENAAIKARDGVAHTGLPTIADDSGIAVDALGGMPGVLSARWCGEHGNDAENNRLLLAQLADVPDSRRGARFVSACVLCLPSSVSDATGLDECINAEGTWEGHILRAEVGDNGFGYDPLFAPDLGDDAAGSAGGAAGAAGAGEAGAAATAQLSSAQLTPEQKDALSHRGKALAKLVPALRALANAEN